LRQISARSLLLQQRAGTGLSLLLQFVAHQSVDKRAPAPADGHYIRES
jgi:hypothetical protein